MAWLVQAPRGPDPDRELQCTDQGTSNAPRLSPATIPTIISSIKRVSRTAELRIDGHRQQEGRQLTTGIMVARLVPELQVSNQTAEIHIIEPLAVPHKSSSDKEALVHRQWPYSR